MTLGFPGSDLWWELATLVTIMVLGHWIEMRSIHQAQGALNELAKLLPDAAVRIVGDRLDTVPVSDLRNSDLVLLRPGAGVPADGIVRDGTSDVGGVVVAAEHDDRHVRMVELDPREAVQAVHIGHANVEQHEIGLMLIGQLQAGGAVVGLSDDANVGTLQKTLDSCANDLVIIHNYQRNCHANLLPRKIRQR